MFKKKLILFFFFVFSSSTLLALSLKEIEDLYDEGHYKEVIEAYETYVENDKISGELLYNLGNAYFRTEEKGRALGAFLGAKRYLPRDADILHNLKHVHSFSKDKLSWEKDQGVLGILTRWADSFTSSEVKDFALVLLFVSVFSLFFAFFLKPFQVLKPLSHLFFGFSLLFFVFVSFSKGQDDYWGAVTGELAKVYSGPGESNSLLFELHEGAPALVQDTQKSWFKIELSDGKKGWVLKDQISLY